MGPEGESQVARRVDEDLVPHPRNVPDHEGPVDRLRVQSEESPTPEVYYLFFCLLVHVLMLLFTKY